MTTPAYYTLGWISQIGTMWHATQSPDYGSKAKTFASMKDAKEFLQAATPRRANWSQDNAADEPERWVGIVYNHAVLNPQ